MRVTRRSPRFLIPDQPWPRNLSQVAKRLARIAPNLRRLGGDVERTRGGSAGARHITLTSASSDVSRQTRQTRQEIGGAWLADQMEGPDGAGWETDVR